MIDRIVEVIWGVTKLLSTRSGELFLKLGRDKQKMKNENKHCHFYLFLNCKNKWKTGNTAFWLKNIHLLMMQKCKFKHEVALTMNHYVSGNTYGFHANKTENKKYYSSGRVTVMIFSAFQFWISIPGTHGFIHESSSQSLSVSSPTTQTRFGSSIPALVNVNGWRRPLFCLDDSWSG